MKSVLTLTAVAAALAAAGCSTAPPTPEQMCAKNVAKLTGNSEKSMILKGSVPTAVGPKIYVESGGATYTCQGDTAGNIGPAELQG